MNTSGNNSFGNFGRLRLTLTIAMLGFLCDYLITTWMLNNFSWFYESNQNLHPEIGLPIMVLNYLIADLVIPREIFFDNIFYSLSLLQWSGPVQNLLVLFKFTEGISFFYALPVIFVTSFVVIHFILNTENRRFPLSI